MKVLDVAKIDLMNYLGISVANSSDGKPWGVSVSNLSVPVVLQCFSKDLLVTTLFRKLLSIDWSVQNVKLGFSLTQPVVTCDNAWRVHVYL